MPQAEGVGPSGNTAPTIRVTDTLKPLAAQWVFTIELIRELSLNGQGGRSKAERQRIQAAARREPPWACSGPSRFMASIALGSASPVLRPAMHPAHRCHGRSGIAAKPGPDVADPLGGEGTLSPTGQPGRLCARLLAEDHGSGAA